MKTSEPDRAPLKAVHLPDTLRLIPDPTPVQAACCRCGATIQGVYAETPEEPVCRVCKPRAVRFG